CGPHPSAAGIGLLFLGPGAGDTKCQGHADGEFGDDAENLRFSLHNFRMTFWLSVVQVPLPSIPFRPADATGNLFPIAAGLIADAFSGIPPVMTRSRTPGMNLLRSLGIALLFINSVRLDAALRISTDFESGSAIVLETNLDTQTIRIKSAGDVKRGWP